MANELRRALVLAACAVVIAYAAYGIRHTANAGYDPLIAMLAIAFYTALILGTALRALRLFPRRAKPPLASRYATPHATLTPSHVRPKREKGEG
jgi:multisubunit Na+/H+ antiporter MnhB subunit